MTMDLSRAKALCAEFDIGIVPKSTYPMPGQTRAVVSIDRLIRNHGEKHVRLVLTILTECKGNDAMIDEMGLSAVSILVQACSDMIEENASAFLELFDQIPFGPLMVIANELRGIVHQGHALAGMLYLMTRNSMSLTGQQATQKCQRAARMSEADKGRGVPGGHRSDREKIEIGRYLLEVKAKLPRGHFGPWLRDKSGLSDGMAHQCMRRAMEADTLASDLKQAA